MSTKPYIGWIEDTLKKLTPKRVPVPGFGQIFYAKTERTKGMLLNSAKQALEGSLAHWRGILDILKAYNGKHYAMVDTDSGSHIVVDTGVHDRTATFCYSAHACALCNHIASILGRKESNVLPNECSELCVAVRLTQRTCMQSGWVEFCNVLQSQSRICFAHRHAAERIITWLEEALKTLDIEKGAEPDFDLYVATQRSLDSLERELNVKHAWLAPLKASIDHWRYIKLVLEKATGAVIHEHKGMINLWRVHHARYYIMQGCHRTKIAAFCYTAHACALCQFAGIDPATRRTRCSDCPAFQITGISCFDAGWAAFRHCAENESHVYYTIQSSAAKILEWLEDAEAALNEDIQNLGLMIAEKRCELHYLQGIGRANRIFVNTVPVSVLPHETEQGRYLRLATIAEQDSTFLDRLYKHNCQELSLCPECGYPNFTHKKGCSLSRGSKKKAKNEKAQYMKLAKAYEVYEENNDGGLFLQRVNQKDAHLTVCPECHIDDFCHVEGCSIAKELRNQKS